MGRQRESLDFELVKSILMETRSVTKAALILGISRVGLSIYLNRKRRKAEWQAIKLAWKRENMRNEKRRWRARVAAGLAGFGCERPAELPPESCFTLYDAE